MIDEQAFKFPAGSKKLEVLRGTVINGVRCKAGDVVVTSEDVRYLIGSGKAKLYTEEVAENGSDIPNTISDSGSSLQGGRKSKPKQK